MNDGLMYSAAAIHTFGIPLGWRTPEEPFFFLGTICFISSYSRNCFSASPGFFGVTLKTTTITIQIDKE